MPRPRPPRAGVARPPRPRGALVRGLPLAVLAAPAGACSFLATAAPWAGENLTEVNEFMRRRGPDGTRCARVEQLTACHNLLHMTGELVPQPFVGSGSSAGIVAVYNGEVYNFRELQAELGLDRVRSDGEVVMPMYERHGPSFPRKFDGEFAVAIFDLPRRLAVLATDIFSTKPLWYSRHGGLRVATYRSGVERLGAPRKTIRMMDPNTVMVFGLDVPHNAAAVPVITRLSVHEFDLRQFKTDTGDFLRAFEQAVAKRMRSNHPAFIGLSSGYDSGAIQVALQRLGHRHASYTIFSTEDIPTIKERLKWTGELVEPHVIQLGEEDRAKEEQFLRDSCEYFPFSGIGRLGSIADDPAAHGLSYIFRHARQRGFLVYMSGTGADEVISDYGFAGKKFFPHSNFGGLFPEDMGSLFPWESLLLGTQRDYLMKEELVAGSHGIESRYPFLDRLVVQEYIWLSASAKNSRYKAPLHELLEGAGYPFIAGEKVGFNADWNVREGGTTLVWTTTPPPSPGRAPRGAAGSPPGALPNGGLEGREAAAAAAQRAVGLRTDGLALREGHLSAATEELETERLQRLQSLLFVLFPRLSRMSIAASSAPAAWAAATPPDGLAGPVHPRWSAVEVVTCVSGGSLAVVADFPVFSIFLASAQLTVHNVCTNDEWQGMHFRIKMYIRFLRGLAASAPSGGSKVLYLVTDGLDVFFNDLSVLPTVANRSGGAPVSRAAVSHAIAGVIAERYEAVVEASSASGEPRKAIVVSTERLCGWGGAKLCSEAEEHQYPESPTDSKYLNAGGYVGPADALVEMIQGVLHLKENADEQDAERGRNSDQFFFKKYFWSHQDKIALDYNQSIFGNFLEVEQRPCDHGWLPRCAVQPCCTVSDDFRRFRDLFYGLYTVQGCAVWRGDNLPVSWHGNGAGKWLYLLSLDQLSFQCPAMANLTLAHFNSDVMRQVYEALEARADAGVGLWRGGFVHGEPARRARWPGDFLHERVAA